MIMIYVLLFLESFQYNNHMIVPVAVKYLRKLCVKSTSTQLQQQTINSNGQNLLVVVVDTNGLNTYLFLEVVCVPLLCVESW